jgi:hypothetical protein
MASGNEKTKRFAANSLFPTLVLAAVALWLAETWAVKMGAGAQVRLLVGIPGLALVAMAFYRSRLHWRPRESRFNLLSVSSLACYLALAGAGGIAGLAVCTGSILALGLLASMAYLIPWAKIPVCRYGFFLSSGITLLGAIGAMTFYGKPMHPLYFIGAGWALLIPTMTMQFLVLAFLDKSYRLDEDSQLHAPVDELATNTSAT